jgi:arginine/lysine/ornithine decarboxylase
MSLIKSYLHQLETMNRSELQDNMIQQILDDMDIKTMMAILYDNMSESYDKYSDKELLEEVKEYYPHILPETNVSELEATANNYTTGK